MSHKKVERDLIASNDSDRSDDPNMYQADQGSTVRILRWSDVHPKIGGRSLSSVTRAEKAGTFPKRVRQGRHIGWLEHEIDDYLLNLPRGIFNRN